MSEIERGRVYYVAWESRDIGYGVEYGQGDYVAWDVDTWGKREFQPLDGSASVYLFSDEIRDVLPARAEA